MPERFRSERKAGDVELNWLPVPDDPKIAASLMSLLAPEEVSRARRLRHAGDRHRFAAGRACLRISLGDRLGVHPREVPIRDGAVGAPSLDPGRPGPAFSVAHSGDWALVALGASTAVGVDLERITAPLDVDGIAVRALTERERSFLSVEDPCLAVRRAVQLWVGKEAVLKMLGCGVALEPSRIELIPNRDNSFEICSRPAELESAGRFAVQLVAAPDGYVAAVAVFGDRIRVTVCNRWLSLPTGAPNSCPV